MSLTVANIYLLQLNNLEFIVSYIIHVRYRFRIRIEHLKCDLNGWGSVCSSDVLGLKTEYECRLIQQHCRNLQVSNFKTICNDQSYAKAQRVTGTGGTGTGPGGAAGSISASVAAVFTSLIFALFIVL